ncbi:hypothetical protein AAFF_G00303070 [Aldrovandia affinis]|uniref:Uncharacterized protein n=1 Tax=Aldrovandia affinis TaxID=143900 RepID=A0AAD7R8F1_9TELE|nr:hypothetical protein AAFF_G00303070 [Aldrovandia affinis]
MIKLAVRILALLVTCAAPPVLGALTARGVAGSCRGVVYLEVNGSAGLPLCHDAAPAAPGPGGSACSSAAGPTRAGGGPGGAGGAGYRIHDNGSLETSVCRPLEIQCKALPDSRELVAYKVVTGLLSALFLLALLLRFGPQMISFIHRRVQGSTWIGPTQSQSVSFYRAQAGVHPNSSTDKRLSYPGLERLAVNSSQNPSSNRNSDSYN